LCHQEAEQFDIDRPSLTLRPPLQRVQTPAKKNSGSLSSEANHTFGTLPLASLVGLVSAKLVVRI
jgi:hypothetical protein